MRCKLGVQNRQFNGESGRSVPRVGVLGVHHRIKQEIEVILTIRYTTELVQHVEEPAEFVVIEGG